MRKSSPLFKAVIELDKELAEKYPVYAENKPLEIGVQKLLLSMGYDTFGDVLFKCLARHCNRSDYLFNILSESNRYCLITGRPVDAVSDKSKKYAIEMLKRIEANRARRGR